MEQPMKSLLAVVVLSLCAAVVIPASAQTKEPQTKIDCDKAKDMKWDAANNKCMKK